MLMYLCAMVLNAVVLLSCDCSSCHKHIVHSCKCRGCELLEQSPSLSQHCECTHSHENSSEIALAVDSERDSKLIKIVVAELPRALADSAESTTSFAHQAPNCPLAVPLSDGLLLSAGGLRAPPVFA